ncbi:MAG: DUF4439 domain-containing protein [Nocardioides sp.]|uniref:DUF4439 domain-containing protein n=1 Tax=Nocardioides sp. TaxID=35761 RepID=UPI003F0A0DAA
MSVLEALQEALAAEHAAVFTLATVGARTSASTQPVLQALLQEAYRQHRTQRDQLRLLVSDEGGEPVAALAAYEVTAPTSAAEVRRAAIGIETACTQTYASVVARTSGDERAWALSALTWSAALLVRLGDAPTAWPGAPELA